MSTSSDFLQLLEISHVDLAGVIVGPRTWEMKPLETLEEQAQTEHSGAYQLMGSRDPAGKER